MLVTNDEQWKVGSPVFFADDDQVKSGTADGSHRLKDGTVLTVSNGAVQAIDKSSVIKNSSEPGLSNSDKFQIKDSLRKGNYWWLALSMIILLLSHVIRAYRWLMLVRPMGYNPSFLNSFFAVMVGYTVNYGVPRLGEISRCTVLDRYEKIPFTKGFGTVIAERVLDMIFFLIVFFLMLFTQYDEISGYMNANIYPPLKEKWNKLSANKVMLGLLLGGGIALVGALFMFRKKITGKFAEKLRAFVKGFAEGLGSVKLVKNPVLFIFFTASIWMCYYGSLHVLFYCLKESSGLGFSEGITAFVFGSITVMITPGGIGAYPYALQKVLFYVYAVSEVVGVSLGWISWLSSFLLTVSIGLMALIILPIYNRNRVILPSDAKQQQA